MAIQQISLEALQFGPNEDPTPKLRRLEAQLRLMQQALNTAIAELNRAYMSKEAASAEDVAPAVGNWDITVVGGSPPVFKVRYNDNGTLRTGTITLS